MSHRRLHYSMAFLMSLFIGLGMLCVPLLATDLGASNFQLGIIGSISGLTYVLVVVTAGAVSDRLGRKRVIITGALLTGLSFTLMSMSHTAMRLTILMAVCGCGMAMFWPVLEAWLSEEGNAVQIRRGLGGFNVSWSAGGALGPFIAGFLYFRSSMLAFLCAAAGTFFVAYLASLHRRPMKLLRVAGADAPPNPAEDEPISVSRPLLYMVWAANFASWFSISQLRVLFPKLAVGLGMEAWVIGLIIFVLGVSLTATFYVMGASGRWHGTVAPLFCAQGFIIFFMLLTSVTRSAIAAALLFLFLGVSFGVTYSYSLYYSVVGSYQKGEASGRHEMALGAGALLGPFLGGAFADLLHAPRAPYLLGAGVVLASVIAESLIFSSSRARGERHSV